MNNMTFYFKGDKVRALKSSGVEKKVWEPEVAKLLDLKKKLAAAQGASAPAKAAPAKGAGKKESKKPTAPKESKTPVQENGVAADPAEVKQLEQEIDKQVRNIFINYFLTRNINLLSIFRVL